ncbi:MAG: pantetheine-phosphate adenylyltransferase [Deltaproteobacteria bacterium]|nr:pantetheine-phosphate adenylyltransferase [Deltaproteobacteria bacterium]
MSAPPSDSRQSVSGLGEPGQRLAVCPGSFDPLTVGHVAIIARGLRLFDRVIVAVSVNIRKQPLFSFEERTTMIREAFDNDPRLQVEALSGLLATWARDRGAVAILRGLRAAADFEYELQMAQMNRHLHPEVDTVFLPSDPGVSYVSSSLVKEVAALGGDVRGLVPPNVHAALMGRLGTRTP